MFDPRTTLPPPIGAAATIISRKPNPLIQNGVLIGTTAVIATVQYFLTGFDPKDYLAMLTVGYIVKDNHLTRQGGWTTQGTDPLYDGNNSYRFFGYTIKSILGLRLADLANDLTGASAHAAGTMNNIAMTIGGVAGLALSMPFRRTYGNATCAAFTLAGAAVGYAGFETIKDNSFLWPMTLLAGTAGPLIATLGLTSKAFSDKFGSAGRTFTTLLGAGAAALYQWHFTPPAYTSLIPDQTTWKLATTALVGLGGGILTNIIIMPNAAERKAERQTGGGKFTGRGIRNLVGGGLALLAVGAAWNYRDKIGGAFNSSASTITAGSTGAPQAGSSNSTGGWWSNIANSKPYKAITGDESGAAPPPNPPCDLPVTIDTRNCRIVVDNPRGVNITTGSTPPSVIALPKGPVTILGPAVPDYPRQNVRVTFGNVQGLVPLTRLRSATISAPAQ